MASENIADLVARLLKRAAEDRACAENSEVIVALLQPQMDMFHARTGHNVYAVRMAVDHRNSAKRDRQYAADLEAAAAALSAEPCPDCGGAGERFDHADDCDNDTCALNGDIDSCNGQVVQCHCCPAPTQ